MSGIHTRLSRFDILKKNLMSNRNGNRLDLSRSIRRGDKKRKISVYFSEYLRVAFD